MSDATPDRPVTPRLELTTSVLFAGGLLLVLQWHLLPSLLAGLLVYALAHLLVPLLRLPMFGHEGARLVAVTLIATVVIALIALAAMSVIAFLRHSGESIPVLVHRLAEIRIFSPFYISVIRIGETTGGVDEAFLRMFEYMEFDKEIRDRIKAAVRYPVIVLVVLAVAVAVVNFAVIPAFARLFESQKVPLPLLTQVLIGTSNFFVAYWPAMLGALIIGIAAVRLNFGTELGRYWWDRNKLRLPLAGPIILRATLARFARGMSLAIRAGVPIVQAMSAVAEVVANSYMALRIRHKRDGVERGERVLRTATASAIFTPVVLEMISVGEETVERPRLPARPSLSSGWFSARSRSYVVARFATLRVIKLANSFNANIANSLNLKRAGLTWCV